LRRYGQLAGSASARQRFSNAGRKMSCALINARNDILASSAQESPRYKYTLRRQIRDFPRRFHGFGLDIRR
jgi:hypothetical protein